MFIVDGVGQVSKKQKVRVKKNRNKPYEHSPGMSPRHSQNQIPLGTISPLAPSNVQSGYQHYRFLVSPFTGTPSSSQKTEDINRQRSQATDSAAVVERQMETGATTTTSHEYQQLDSQIRQRDNQPTNVRVVLQHDFKPNVPDFNSTQLRKIRSMKKASDG